MVLIPSVSLIQVIKLLLCQKFCQSLILHASVWKFAVNKLVLDFSFMKTSIWCARVYYTPSPQRGRGVYCFTSVRPSWNLSYPLSILKVILNNISVISWQVPLPFINFIYTLDVLLKSLVLDFFSFSRNELWCLLWCLFQWNLK